MACTEKQFREINSELHKVNEEQFQTLHALAKQEEVEKDIFVANKKSHQLFDELFHSWHQDRELLSFFEEKRSKLQFEKQKIKYDMDNKRKGLTQKSRRLNTVEDNLYVQLRPLE